MSSKKKDLNTQENGESDSGASGASGRVAFRNFLDGAAEVRDDLLPPEEIRRLLSVHKDVHAIEVKKQKALQDQRKAMKEGKISLQSYRQGMQGAGMHSQYKVNPILANKAQFSGIDRQVNALPTENMAETNEAQRNELENEYRLRFAPGMTPVFHPKPQFNK